jgi:hypothetical protein
MMLHQYFVLKKLLDFRGSRNGCFRNTGSGATDEVTALNSISCSEVLESFW